MFIIFVNVCVLQYNRLIALSKLSPFPFTWVIPWSYTLLALRYYGDSVTLGLTAFRPSGSRVYRSFSTPLRIPTLLTLPVSEIQFVRPTPFAWLKIQAMQRPNSPITVKTMPYSWGRWSMSFRQYSFGRRGNNLSARAFNCLFPVPHFSGMLCSA